MGEQACCVRDGLCMHKQKKHAHRSLSFQSDFISTSSFFLPRPHLSTSLSMLRAQSKDSLSDLESFSWCKQTTSLLFVLTTT